MTFRNWIRRFTLGALALWLGLWPAGDAITGASNIMLDLSPQEAPLACQAGAPAEAPACAPGTGCHQTCRGEPAPAACAPARTLCGADCRSRAQSDCTNTQTARCGQCQCIGGLVLFADSPPQFEPDLKVVGMLSAAGSDATSRCPRPPLRPPVPVRLPSA